MGLQKVYWPTLVRMVIILCNYVDRNYYKFPEDVKDVINPWVPAFRISCQLLRTYDKNTPRGGISDAN